MSYYNDVLASIPQIKQNLRSVFMAPDSATIEPVPTLEVLKSPAMNSGLKQSVTKVGSKIGKVTVVYDQEIPLSKIKEDVSNPTCQASEVYGQCEFEYDMDPTENFAADELIDSDDLTTAYTNNAEHFSRRLFQLMCAVERKLDVEHAADLVALSGPWGQRVTAPSDIFTIQTYDPSDIYRPNPFALQRIRKAVMDSGFSTTPFLIGGSDMWDYMETVKGGSTTNNGVDISAIVANSQVPFIYSPNVKDALGSSAEALAIAPGAATLLEWTKRGWKDGINMDTGANYAHFSIPSPRTGIPFDVILKDDCGSLSINVIATTKLVGMPDDMYHPNGNYAGVKFINKIEVDNS